QKGRWRRDRKGLPSSPTISTRSDDGDSDADRALDEERLELGLPHVPPGDREEGTGYRILALHIPPLPGRGQQPVPFRPYATDGPVKGVTMPRQRYSTYLWPKTASRQPSRMGALAVLFSAQSDGPGATRRHLRLTQWALELWSARNGISRRPDVL